MIDNHKKIDKKIDNKKNKLPNWRSLYIDLIKYIY
jgi:hypothetical protein